MNKNLLIYLKEKNYYEYLKENSFYIKNIIRTNNLVDFINFIKDKYRLRTTDKISDAIDNLDMISTILSELN